MAKAPENESTPEVQDFIVRLTNMHHEAMRIGLFATGHKIHDAVREVGFEAGRIIEKKKKEPTHVS